MYSGKLIYLILGRTTHHWQLFVSEMTAFNFGVRAIIMYAITWYVYILKKVELLDNENCIICIC